MKHSAIVCTRNRPRDILVCLQSLAAQTQSFDQIVIVDSSNVPLTTRDDFLLAFSTERFGNVTRTYCHTASGLPFQRNRGVELATGDIVYFFDDDAIVAPDYLAVMTEVFVQHPEYAGGMGDITDFPPQSVFAYYFYRLFGLHGPRHIGSFTWAGMTKQAYGAPTHRMVQSVNGCGAYRREIVYKYQFDERLPGRAALEDADFSWRVSQNHKLFFEPRAKLQHVPSVDGREDMTAFHAQHMRHYFYFFFKNVWPTGRWKIMACMWAVIGLFVHGLLKVDRAELWGYCRGVGQYLRWGVDGEK